MRLFSFISSFAGVALLAVLASGCHRGEQAAESAEHLEQAFEGVSFKEGKGLRVPKETADFIGLQIMDVGEQNIADTFRFQAKIYRPASATSEQALASAMVRESELQHIRSGQHVTLQGKGGPLEGTVAALSKDAVPGNGREVLLSVTDPKRSLAMGDAVTAAVSKSKAEATVGVPLTSLLRTAEGVFVYTVSGDHFVRTAVKVGASNDQVIEIKDGLYAGDQIVVSPVMTLWMAELQSIRGGTSCADGH